MKIDCSSTPSSLSDEDFLGFVHEMTRELKLMARERGFHQLAPALTGAEDISRKLCHAIHRRKQQKAASNRTMASAPSVTPAKAEAHG